MQAETNLIKKLGKIAGIGGIALGVFFLLFKEIMSKNIFPMLTNEQAYSLLSNITVFVFIIALVGIVAWVFTTTPNKGISFEQYKTHLDEKEKEIRKLIVAAERDSQKQKELKIELAQVKQLRVDEKESYQAYIKSLEERVKRLDKLVGQVPDKLIEEAKQALIKGETAKAESLFKQVEEQAEPHIKAAAEAAYQRGKLAEDDINYSEAWNNYQRAVQLNPDDTEYLNTAGMMAHTLAKHDRAKKFFELALASDLKTYGEGHPNVATRRNNLGSAWESLGEYQKAIEYYELALASNLKTYGEDHPKVAIDRNNLGGVWHSLGEYQKAVEYFEQALRIFTNSLGKEHPNTQTVQENLNRAIAERDKD